jgi:hypothetical protein
MASDLRTKAYETAEHAQGEAFDAAETVYEVAATLTSSLLSRLPLPDNGDEAAGYAVSLFWRVKRGLESESPEQARPDHPDLRVNQKRQP